MSTPRLTASHILEYPYRRSVGPIMGSFFTGLKEQRILGIRTVAGKVLVPPVEYDPATGDTLTDLTAVGPVGAVTTWAWVTAPRPKHPLAHPFAWALIRPDGADSALLHAVDAGDPARMRTGMRVRPRWRDERVGDIHDIVCFEPDA